MIDTPPHQPWLARGGLNAMTPYSVALQEYVYDRKKGAGLRAHRLVEWAASARKQRVVSTFTCPGGGTAAVAGAGGAGVAAAGAARGTPGRAAAVCRTASAHPPRPPAAPAALRI